MLQEDINKWVMSRVQKGRSVTTEEVAVRFGVTRQTAHRYLRELVRAGNIVRVGRTRLSVYAHSDSKQLSRIAEGKTFKRRLKRRGLAEDKVFSDLEAEGFLNSLSPEARKILHYAFTEMLNNAIDHSGSSFVLVKVDVNRLMAQFEVIDQGVGIFSHIRQKENLGDLFEAIQELVKGKLTTAPKNHSGEGIFFTSKVADRLELDSEGKCLLFDNELQDVFIKNARKRRGTRVYFKIDSKTKKDLEDLFGQYTTGEFVFDKTRVQIRLFEIGTEFVSRSEAKRFLANLDKFREVVVDFKGVNAVGQGFADQVFRIFQQQHPNIVLEPINMNENVAFMINRARKAP